MILVYSPSCAATTTTKVDFFFPSAPYIVQDLDFLTRIKPVLHAVERQSPNNWTHHEVQEYVNSSFMVDPVHQVPQ